MGGYFSTLLSTTDHPGRKLVRNYIRLNTALQANIQAFHVTAAEYTLTQWDIAQEGLYVSHKTSLNKFKKTEIVQISFPVTVV